MASLVERPIYTLDESDEESDFVKNKSGAGPSSGNFDRIQRPDMKEGLCHHCGKGNDLLSCETCMYSYHAKCLLPALRDPIPSNWKCPECVCYLNELEKILDFEMRPSTVNDSDASELGSNQVMMKHYLVKWKGRSYIHCAWVPEKEFIKAFKSNPRLRTKVNNFHRQASSSNNTDDEYVPIRTDWILVDRIIACRDVEHGKEYLVKWKELPYDECSWERASDIASFASEIEKFERIQSRRVSAGKQKSTFREVMEVKNKQKDFQQYGSSPDFLSGDTCDTSALQAALPSLEDVMKLLKGTTDSQRLAGLLLVTKLCDKDDQPTILKIYHAVGSTFLHRLLLTGMGKGGGGASIDNADRRAYLQLSVTVLATFSRVPEIAASHQMLSNIPLVLEVLPEQSDFSLIEQCFEFLFLVSAAQDDGVITLYRSGGMNVLSSQMPALPDGSHVMGLAMKLVQLIMTKLPSEQVYVEHPSELSKMVSSISKQLARLHNALKFEALHLLSTLLSSSHSGVLCSALQSLGSDEWSANIRVGVINVLQNRVGSTEKLHALALAERSISIVGEEWLIGPTNLRDGHSYFPTDRCILLVLESSRVEIAVHLNEIAYLKYEGIKNSTPSEAFLGTLRNLGVAFSLVERIIKLISKFGENEESKSAPIINESTLIKMICGLNETIGVVLDYLQDAKDHKDRKGDDLLASVRVVGSYLAEAPSACNEKVKELLDYMLSVQGEDEFSPFHSITFLLPMLSQITMEKDGCQLFASTRAFKAVVGLLVSLVDSSDSSIDNSSTILLACDTILNFLLKREQDHFTLDNSCSVEILQALSRWTEDTSDLSVIMMASSICSLLLRSNSKEALLHHSEFNTADLTALSQLMKRSLVTCGQDLMSDGDGDNSEADLYEIVNSGYDCWADRFPHIKEAVGR